MPKVYLLDARCPKCGRRPPDRYPVEAVEFARTIPPATEYRNILCRCGIGYRVAFAALANAIEREVEADPTAAPWAA